MSYSPVGQPGNRSESRRQFSDNAEDIVISQRFYHGVTGGASEFPSRMSSGRSERKTAKKDAKIHAAGARVNRGQLLFSGFTAVPGIRQP
jgi:hypothetical protein